MLYGSMTKDQQKRIANVTAALEKMAGSDTDSLLKEFDKLSAKCYELNLAIQDIRLADDSSFESGASPRIVLERMKSQSISAYYDLNLVLRDMKALARSNKI